MFKKHLNNQKGFTLIEMVIVIVVIGILMGLAFQGVSGIQQNARDTRRLADLEEVRTYLELFFGRCGHYPVTTSTSTSCGTPPAAGAPITWGSASAPAATTLRSILGLVVLTDDVPVDPVPATPYQYWFGPNGLTYVMGADTERRGINAAFTAPTGFAAFTCSGGTGLYCIRN